MEPINATHLQAHVIEERGWWLFAFRAIHFNFAFVSFALLDQVVTNVIYLWRRKKQQQNFVASQEKEPKKM